MDELPQQPRIVRKSSYGRTQLFLREPGVIFRDMRSTGITRRDAASVYHTIPDAYNATGCCCWHCCEPIEDNRTVIPLPVVYDSQEQVYHTYGRTCSPGCAKAYVLEHATFDRGQHLNVLMRMLREVFDVTGYVVETPPRPALKRFGGTFDPTGQRRAVCRLLTPPFVSYCMVVEEQGTGESVPSVPTIMEEDNTLDEPQPPPEFEQFVARRAEAGPSSLGPPVTTRRKRAVAEEVPTGPMSKFVKKK